MKTITLSVPSIRRFSALAFLGICFFHPGNSPAQEPTPTPEIPPIENPTPTPPPGTNPEESFPVVISYGQGQETRVAVYRGIMEPVGLPPNQTVTVTLLLPSTRAGQPVNLGPYDGGQIGAAGSQTSLPLPVLIVATDGTLQFTFQAGGTFGLYRVLATIGFGQCLLQFYVVAPGAGSPPLPSPNPI